MTFRVSPRLSFYLQHIIIRRDHVHNTGAQRIRVIKAQASRLVLVFAKGHSPHCDHDHSRNTTVFLKTSIPIPNVSSAVCRSKAFPFPLTSTRLLPSRCPLTDELTGSFGTFRWARFSNMIDPVSPNDAQMEYRVVFE